MAIRRILICLVLLLVAACAPVRVKPPSAAPEALAAQTAREALLAPHESWTLEARIAVSGENGGTGDLVWRQRGSVYQFSVRGANGKTLRLSGDVGRAVLEGVDAQPDVGADPEALLRDRLGADVPFAGLRAWALGLRIPDVPAQIQFDPRNLPTVIEQQGWTVEYLDWFSDREVFLPKKVYATKGKAKVKLLIQAWSLDN